MDNGQTLISDLTRRLEERTAELAHAKEALRREIEERMQAQNRLQFSDAAFRSIQEAMVAFDLNQRIVHWNEASERIYGVPASEALGRRLSDVVDIIDAYPGQVGGFFDELESKGHARLEALHRTRRAEVWLDASVHEIRDAGRRTGFIALATDITDRKQAEEALLDSEERFSGLVNNLRMGVFRSTVGREGRFLEVNPAMEEITGYSREELLRMNVADLYCDPKMRESVLREAETSGKVTRDLNLKRKDGTKIVVTDAKVAIRDVTGEIAYLDGVLEDITGRVVAEQERREIEQRAQLASRLASIGEMASGIAHEINNPVASIVGFAELLLERDLPEDVREDLGVIHQEAERTAGIVRKLLTFSRSREPEREFVNVNEIVQTSIDLRVYELETNNISVITQFDPDLPWTVADGNQLQQVFLNLIINAELELKQTRRGGILHISTEADGNTIRLTFADNGRGIAEGNLARIFDPFFTTRKGKGTGLGLSVCHGIISEHGGRIFARSEEGQGATFVIELPVVRDGKQIELPSLNVESVAEPGAARILVVDDEPPVLRFLCRTLRRRGHTADGVSDARGVLTQIRRCNYDLVLLDIKLPGTSGIEIYRHLRARHPALAKRVVFITGDVMGADTRRFLSRTKARCVAKPFSGDQLRAEVDRALAELDHPPKPLTRATTLKATG